MFIAAIRRYSERNLAYLNKVMEKRADDPLRALWEYSWDEATGTLMTEFMALGNHRKSIRTEIAGVAESVRKLQLAPSSRSSVKMPGHGAICPCRPCNC